MKTFNRTILELKLSPDLRHDDLSQTFNRTILELKRRQFIDHTFQLCTFNRTILELKRIIFDSLLVAWTSFNRTILELKQSYDRLLIRCTWSFNRTILELKRIKSEDGIFSCSFFQSYHTGIETWVLWVLHTFLLLSIVPYWNWNGLTISMLADILHFQSYHTGIETWYFTELDGFDLRLSIVPYWNWNFSKAMINSFDRVLSIVPYWNWNFEKFLNDVQKIDFQSYHTGIETGGIRQVWHRSALFQSYHTGIETNQEKKQPPWKRSFNRTILELKLVSYWHMCICKFLSIVPYWNWNKTRWLSSR